MSILLRFCYGFCYRFAWVIVSGFRTALDLVHIPLETSFVHGALNGLNLVVLIIVFTPYLLNAVVSAKSPLYLFCLVRE